MASYAADKDDSASCTPRTTPSSTSLINSKSTDDLQPRRAKKSQRVHFGSTIGQSASLESSPQLSETIRIFRQSQPSSDYSEKGEFVAEVPFFIEDEEDADNKPDSPAKMDVYNAKIQDTNRDNDTEYNVGEKIRANTSFDNLKRAAARLVRSHSNRIANAQQDTASDTGESSRPNSPNYSEKTPSSSSSEFTHFKGGILSQLLKLYSHSQNIYTNKQSYLGDKEWSNTAKNYINRAISSNQLIALGRDNNSMVNLLDSQKSSTASLNRFFDSFDNLSNLRHYTKKLKKLKNKKKSPRHEEELKISIQVADILQRQLFMKKICHALMLYGSPTHRLEEQMRMTSEALYIEGQFLYIPGAMIMSFGDSATHTSEVDVIRVINVSLDLGKLQQLSDICKFVVHGVMGVEEAQASLDEIIRRPQFFKTWVSILFFGFASAAVSPLAFGGGWVDIPIAFILGSLVGILQLIAAPKCQKYYSALEIIETIIVSFLARAFGSIKAKNGEKIFCYPSLAMSGIVLILPGYTVLCGALELQFKCLVAGSVRMFYAIIYSLFLSFGILLGSVIFGFMYDGATQERMCYTTIPPLFRILFVSILTLSLMIVNQARPKQFFIMFLTAFCGYVVSFFSNDYLGSVQIATFLSAFTIGLIGNLYSRLAPYFKLTQGTYLAFAAMLPGVLLIVPSALAAQGGMREGINTAIEIHEHFKNRTSSKTLSEFTGSQSFTFGLNMVQVAIGMTTGLFVSALVIYPMGKKRSGIFAF